MTREEAKSWLRKLYARADITDEYGDMEDMQPYEEAINMAITALSENKGDLISRQKVLNTLDVADNFLDEERTVEKYKELLTECIEALPPAENKGEWIDDVKLEIDKAKEPYITNTAYDEGVRFGLMLAYQIVDRYKAESEDKNGNNTK